jgi:hypothetical protein
VPIITIQIIGAVGSIRNSMTSLKGPDSPWQSELLGCCGLVVLQEWKRSVCLKRLKYTQPERLRKVGRPGARWRDEVTKDEGVLGIRTWRSTAMSQEEWRNHLEENKTCYEL